MSSSGHSWPPSSRPPSHPPGTRPPYHPPGSSSRSHHPSSTVSSSHGHHHSSSGGNSSRHHHSSHHHHQSSSSQYHHEEDRLGRAWRTLASSVVMSTQKAEKAAAQQPEPSRESLKELNDAVVTFLRARMEWGRQISHIEAKLQGKAQENETMDCYLRCQPRLGRKRKRQEDATTADSTSAAQPEATDATAAPATQPTPAPPS